MSKTSCHQEKIRDGLLFASERFWYRKTTRKGDITIFFMKFVSDRTERSQRWILSVSENL